MRSKAFTGPCIPASESGWLEGRLKKFSGDCGYGFIESEEGDALVYAQTFRTFGMNKTFIGGSVRFRYARRSSGLVVTELAPSSITSAPYGPSISEIMRKHG
jgi:cold shock CspA family protein